MPGTAWLTIQSVVVSGVKLVVPITEELATGGTSHSNHMHVANDLMLISSLCDCTVVNA